MFYEPQSRKSCSAENLIFTTFFATSARALQCLWDIFVKRHSNDGIVQSFSPRLLAPYHKNSCFIVFYATRWTGCFCIRVPKTSYFTGFYATPYRKPHIFMQFPRGPFFPQRSLENTVFHEGLRHTVLKTLCFTYVWCTPDISITGCRKHRIFAVIFATPHKKQRILHGFGADPIFLQQGNRNTVFYELFCNVAQKTS